MGEIAADIRSLFEQLDAAERDARLLVTDLSDEEGARRITPDSWSVAECFDHLAVANRVYLAAMRGPAAEAVTQGKLRQHDAVPGLIGAWFVKAMEPPVRTYLKMKSPQKIRPRQSPPLSRAHEDFAASQNDVRSFLNLYSGLDLTLVRFPNPFISGVRFSLAIGLHVIIAHERRHLWQAWQLRRAMTER